MIIITFGALGVNAADKFVLVIDAGHGGHDPGARGKVSLEKNINLSVALAFGKYVERNCPDVKVIYTRKTDVFIELSERANIANKNKADLFISIHTNALDGGKISRGFETYTLGISKASENLNVAKRENSVILIEKNYKQRYAGFDPNSSESYIMFELMQDKNMANSVELAKTIQSEVCASSGRVNKGVHQAGFLVLRETSMPSCLLELGFITTTDEETYLNTTEGQDKMARGIYNAFVKYKRKHGMKLAQNDDNESQDYENPEYDMVSNGMRSSVEELAEGETPEGRQYDNDRELSQNERRMAEEASHIIKEEDELMMTMTEYAQPREVRSLENFLAQTIPPVEPQPGVGLEQNVQPPESPGPGTKEKAQENTKLMAADNTTKGPPVEIAPTTPEKTPKTDSTTASTTPTKSVETTEPKKSSIDTTPEKENTTVSQSQSTAPSTHQKDLAIADDIHPTTPIATSEETTPTTQAKEVPSSEPSSTVKEDASPVPSTPEKEEISPLPATTAKEEGTPAPATPAKEEETAAPATLAKEEETPAPATPAKEEETPAPVTPAKEEETPAPATPAKEEITSEPATPANTVASTSPEVVPPTPIAPAVNGKDTTSTTTPAASIARVNPTKETSTGTNTPVAPVKSASVAPTTTVPNNSALKEVATPPQGMALKGKPIFKVQIAASSEPKPVDSDFFKGVKDIDIYRENGMVKYAVGATENFAEVEKLRASLLDKFPGAFIVAFRDGYKVSLQHALTEYRKQQKQQK